MRVPRGSLGYAVDLDIFIEELGLTHMGAFESLLSELLGRLLLLEHDLRVLQTWLLRGLGGRHLRRIIEI